MSHIFSQLRNYLYNIVKSTRNHPAAIRRESYGTYSTSMTFVCVDASFLSYIPYLKISVHRSRCKKFTKRMEFTGSAIWSVSRKSANHYTSRTITGLGVMLDITCSSKHNRITYFVQYTDNLKTWRMLSEILLVSTSGRDRTFN